jgi:hypothetical protein
MFQVTTVLPEPHDNISKIPTLDKEEKKKPVVPATEQK